VTYSIIPETGEKKARSTKLVSLVGRLEEPRLRGASEG